MTIEQASQHRTQAEEKREQGEYVTAGHYYSQAAFEIAGVGAFINTSDGTELRRLLEACTCYRIGGADQWCRNRARLGELLAEEWAQRVFTKPEPSYDFDRAERGVWYEYIGDFRTVGQLGDPDPMYARAKEIYRDAGDPMANLAETPQKANISYFNSLARAAGKDMEEVYSITKNGTFSEWVEYKQKHLVGILETIIENESYPIPG